jgi:hypothetical protein
MPFLSPHFSLSSSPALEEASPIYILSPKEITTLPEFFEIALPKLVLTSPEKKEANKGSFYLGELWVYIDTYSFNLLPLYACHFNTEEGFRPLFFIHFAI